jgi:hypothetical protein
MQQRGWHAKTVLRVGPPHPATDFENMMNNVLPKKINHR